MPRRIEEYLHISPDDARSQWRRIKGRTPRPRQEPFLPIEVVLSYALFWLLDPHRFGGGNIDKVPAEVHALARTFVRSPGSLTSKMLNLEGARSNGARVEPELFLRLAREPDRFVALYKTILSTARQEGLSDALVPDVLGLLHPEHDLHLLGQEEIGTRELDQIFNEKRDDLHTMESAFSFDEQSTTRIVEQRVRLGQHRFARDVLATYQHQCAFCGFAPRALKRHGLLIASHIKPWSQSTDRERLDPRNGIAACPIHDKAFDTGLLTVNGGLRIHRASALDASMAAEEGSERYFATGILKPALLVPDGESGPRKKYLDYHKRHIFLGSTTTRRP